jgi:hypothetical protein
MTSLPPFPPTTRAEPQRSPADPSPQTPPAPAPRTSLEADKDGGKVAAAHTPDTHSASGREQRPTTNRTTLQRLIADSRLRKHVAQQMPRVRTALTVFLANPIVSGIIGGVIAGFLILFLTPWLMGPHLAATLDFTSPGVWNLTLKNSGRSAAEGVHVYLRFSGPIKTVDAPPDVFRTGTNDQLLRPNSLWGQTNADLRGDLVPARVEYHLAFYCANASEPKPECTITWQDGIINAE